MQLKPEDISQIIKAQIKNYDSKLEQSETGTILQIGDGIAQAYGLEKCMANELVEFSNGEYGMALNLEENSVAIVVLGTDQGIKEGDIVKRTGRDVYKRQHYRILARHMLGSHLKKVGVVAAGKPTVSRHHHIAALFDLPGHDIGGRKFFVAVRNIRQSLMENIKERTGPLHPLLGSSQLGGSHKLHGLGDLHGALHTLDPEFRCV